MRCERVLDRTHFAGEVRGCETKRILRVGVCTSREEEVDGWGGREGRVGTLEAGGGEGKRTLLVAGSCSEVKRGVARAEHEKSTAHAGGEGVLSMSMRGGRGGGG